MSKYLKKFETVAQYESAKPNLILPNVSLIEAGNLVEYNPTTPPTPVETRLVCKYNVTDTSSETKLCNYTDNFSAIEIDGVEQVSVVDSYQFDSTGEHTVKFTLTDPTSLPFATFYYCEDISSIDFPNSITSIGAQLCYYNNSLTSITLPDNVTIGELAFNACTSLTRVNSSINGVLNIPSGVTLGSRVFERCGEFTAITVDANNATYDSRNNCNAIIETSTNKLLLGCKNTVIPNTVTSIERDAFYECTGLTSITIPDSVTAIGASAFGNCRSLTTITIPTGVTSITQSLFEGCSGLTTVNMPSGITFIDMWAFRNCSGLTSITIPSAVTRIGQQTFNNCVGLTSIDIPSGVTRIGSSGFYGCTGLTSVTVNATTPPTLDSNAFDATNNCPIYVPSGSVSTYKSSQYWFIYSSRIEAIQ